MIQDVDESLRALVKKDALNGSRAEVAFDAPTREWAARRNTPTVDLYLYDIREDLEKREVQWMAVRGPDGLIGERRPPARRFKLSYLVTAWTQRPEDEHRLLSALLACFIRHEKLPVEFASGELVASGLPVYLNIALPPPQDRSISDVWSALGGELKPSLDLVVNAAVAVTLSQKAGPPVREAPRISMSSADAGEELVRQPARGGARSGRTRADSGGGPAAAGAAGGAAAAEASSTGADRQAAAPVEKGRAGGTKGGGALTQAEPEQKETIQSGHKRQPGRVITLKGIPRH